MNTERTNIRVFVIGHDGRFANPLVVALEDYLAHCLGVGAEIHACLEGVNAPYGVAHGNARVGATLQQAHRIGQLPFSVGDGSLTSEVAVSATRMFREVPKICSYVRDQQDLPRPGEYDLYLSTSLPRDGYHMPFSPNESAVLSNTWGAVDGAFLQQVCGQLLSLLSSAIERRRQRELVESDSTETPQPQAHKPTLDPDHWAYGMDLGLEADLSQIPDALKQAMVDLFAGKPNTPWYRWLAACVMQGMMGRLPEVAMMWDERNTVEGNHG